MALTASPPAAPSAAPTSERPSDPRRPLTPPKVVAAKLPHLGAGRRALLKSLLLSFGWGVEVIGRDRLRRVPDPAIFAFNHLSNFEAIAVPLSMIFLRDGALVHFLVDWMYLHVPLVGDLIRQGEPIPVYRKRAIFGIADRYRRARHSRPVVDACLARLHAGESVGVYPEGARNPRPDRLLRGRSGLGWLVLGSTAPVVPVGIRFPASEVLGRQPFVGRIELRIGEPLTFDSERSRYTAAPASEQASLGRRSARRIVATVMAELALLSGKTAKGPTPSPSSYPRLPRSLDARSVP